MRKLTKSLVDARTAKFIEHGYLAFEGTEIVVTPKGQRVLTSILFLENAPKLETVIDEFLADKAKEDTQS